MSDNNEEKKYIDKGLEINERFNNIIGDYNVAKHANYGTNNVIRIGINELQTGRLDVIPFIAFHYKPDNILQILFLYNTSSNSEVNNIDKLVNNFNWKKYGKDTKQIIIKDDNKKIVENSNYTIFPWKNKNVDRIDYKYIEKNKNPSEVKWEEKFLEDLMYYIVGKLNFEGCISLNYDEENIKRFFIVTNFRKLV
jgi:hypothetical protein